METNTAPAKGALARKLAAILGEIGKVEKTGENSFHHYKYVTESALVWAVRKELAAAKVFVFTSTEAQDVKIIHEKGENGAESTWALTTVTTRHTFVDGESGEEFSVLSQGQGADNGDKGGYKAITGAMKYFIYKCFMIPTDDDPEGDDKTDKRTASGSASRTSTTVSSSKPPVEVPRDASSTDKMRDQFRGKKWESHAIHFGKQQGKKLGELDEKSLSWWITGWQPKPYQGAISQENIRLRAALDVANEEWK